MSDTQFTPGPWHYQEESDAYTHILRDSTGEFIASTPQWSNGIAEANARLIAAAPELYEALKELVKACPSNLPCSAFHHRKADHHDFGTPCPVQGRYESAQEVAEAALAKAVRP